MNFENYCFTKQQHYKTSGDIQISSQQGKQRLLIYGIVSQEHIIDSVQKVLSQSNIEITNLDIKFEDMMNRLCAHIYSSLNHGCIASANGTVHDTSPKSSTLTVISYKNKPSHNLPAGWVENIGIKVIDNQPKPKRTIYYYKEDSRATNVIPNIIGVTAMTWANSNATTDEEKLIASVFSKDSLAKAYFAYTVPDERRMWDEQPEPLEEG